MKPGVGVHSDLVSARGWLPGRPPAPHLVVAALLALAVIAANSLYAADKIHSAWQSANGPSPYEHPAVYGAKADRDGSHKSDLQKKLRACVVEVLALVASCGSLAPPVAHTAPEEYLPSTEARARTAVPPQLLQRPPPRG